MIAKRTGWRRMTGTMVRVFILVIGIRGGEAFFGLGGTDSTEVVSFAGRVRMIFGR